MAGQEIEASAGAGIQLNTPAEQGWRLVSNRIVASGYGILLNVRALGTSGLALTGNVVTAGADAVELNVPRQPTASNIAVVGNILSSPAGALNKTSGFAFGAAACNGVAFTGNVIAESRNEAVHLESAHRNYVISGNVIRGCRADGIRILTNGHASPVVVVGNQVEAATTGEGTGYHQINDLKGTISGCNVVGNQFRNFGIGARFSGRTHVVFDGNVIEGCPVAIRASGFTELSGSNLIRRGAVLLQAAGGRVSVGRFICDGFTPERIIEKARAEVQCLAIVRGFSYPINTSPKLRLCPLPSRMQGVMRVSYRKRNLWRYRELAIAYDGFQITQEEMGALRQGPAEGQGIGIVDGWMYWDVGAGATDGRLDFDGTYVVV